MQALTLRAGVIGWLRREFINSEIYDRI